MDDKTLARIADALETIASALNKGSKSVPVNNEILTERIDDLLLLSGRAKKICARLGVVTVMDICGWTRSAIIQQQGMGKITFDELDRLLRRNGLQWGTWQSPAYLKFTETHRHSYGGQQSI